MCRYCASGPSTSNSNRSSNLHSVCPDIRFPLYLYPRGIPLVFRHWWHHIYFRNKQTPSERMYFHIINVVPNILKLQLLFRIIPPSFLGKGWLLLCFGKFVSNKNKSSYVLNTKSCIWVPIDSLIMVFFTPLGNVDVI